MSEPENKVKYLESLLNVSDQTRKSVKFVDSLIGHPNIPPSMYMSLSVVKMTLEIQDVLIRQLSELELAIEDRLETLVVQLKGGEENV